MMAKTSRLAIAASLVLHAGLLAMFASSVLQQRPPPPAPLPVVVRLLQAQQVPAAAPPKTPEQPTPPKPQPVPPKPVAPAPVAPLPTPVPKSVAPPPAPVAPAAPVAPVAPVAPSAPSVPTVPTVPAAPVAPPAPATPPAPPMPAAAPASPARTDVSISASYGASNIKPVYPSMSKRLGEQGLVLLRVLVRSDGSAGTVEVKSSSGFPRLDQAAADAVKTWHFNPATSEGKAIDEWYQVPIPFKIQN